MRLIRRAAVTCLASLQSRRATLHRRLSWTLEEARVPYSMRAENLERYRMTKCQTQIRGHRIKIKMATDSFRADKETINMNSSSSMRRLSCFRRLWKNKETTKQTRPTLQIVLLMETLPSGMAHHHLARPMESRISTIRHIRTYCWASALEVQYTSMRTITTILVSMTTLVTVDFQVRLLQTQLVYSQMDHQAMWLGSLDLQPLHLHLAHLHWIQPYRLPSLRSLSSSIKIITKGGQLSLPRTKVPIRLLLFWILTQVTIVRQVLSQSEKFRKCHSKFLMLLNFKTTSIWISLIGHLRTCLQLVLVELCTFGQHAHLESQNFLKYLQTLMTQLQVWAGLKEEIIWLWAQTVAILKFGTQLIKRLWGLLQGTWVESDVLLGTKVLDSYQLAAEIGTLCKEIWELLINQFQN